MSADPQNLGPYRIVRRVGAGGMGVVYEAVHTGLDKRVALKVLPRELASNRLERFLREARTAAALHHTNIVPVFDVGQVDGVPYFAMQFIDGRPLDATPETRTRGHEPEGTKSFAPPDATADHVPAQPATPSNGPPTPRDPRGVVAQVLQAAEGVAHAHDRGVVHRDIKPANLLLDASGVVWVADFGLAFRAGDPTMTADGAVIGTPRYMSPEQARGEKADARTDVYSLGVTLYELLTGAVAFPGETLVEVLQKVITHTPPSPRSLDRRISTDLEQVVLKAMAKRRDDRYANGREFADDLQRFLSGEPVRARRIGPVGKAWRWSKRNPAVAALLAAVLLVFALGAGASAYYAKQAEKREGDAKANERRAVEKEGEANAERRNVEDAARANRRLLYAARMGLAGTALKERNHDRVSELLGETMPAVGEDDPRGWEWHYLFRQVYSESRVIPLEPVTPLYSGPDRVIDRGDHGTWRGRAYDAETGKPLRTIANPPGTVFDDVTVSADGRRVFRATPDVLRVWDIETAKEVAGLKLTGNRHDNRQHVLVGDTFAAVVPVKDDARDEPARAEVWDIKTGKSTPLPAPPGFGPLARPRRLVLSPGGRRLAALDATNRLVVWDVPSAAVLLNRTPIDTAQFVVETAVAFSPDEVRMVVRSADASGVEVYDLTGPRAKLVLSQTGLSEQVEHVAFSPDGGRVLVTLVEGECRVLDLSGRGAAARFRFTDGHTLNAAFFRPDGNRVFAHTSSGIREWDLTRAAVVRPGGAVSRFNVGLGISIGAFNPDGSKLALAGVWDDSPQEGEVRIWNLAGRTHAVVPTALFGRSIDQRGVAWTADGRWAGVVVREAPTGPWVPPLFSEWARLADEWTRRLERPVGERVLLIDADSGRVSRVQSWPKGFTTTVRSSPCGRWLVCEGDFQFVVLDAATMRTVWEFPADGERIVYTEFTPDSRMIVTRDGGTGGSEVFARDLATGRETRFDAPGAACLGTPALSPDGRWLAAKTGAHHLRLPTLRVWDARTGKAVAAAQLGEDNAANHKITFSPCGRWLATQLRDRRVELFDTEAWTRRHSLAAPTAVPEVYFTPDGRRLLGFCTDARRQELKVWDTDTGQELLAVPCHAGPGLVDALRPHFDGAKLTFVRAAGAARLLELETLDGTPVPDASARERLRLK